MKPVAGEKYFDSLVRAGERRTALYGVDDMPKEMTTRQAAHFLAVEHDTVSLKCRKGIIKARKVMGQWSIPREEIERYLEKGTEDELQGTQG